MNCRLNNNTPTLNLQSETNRKSIVVKIFFLHYQNFHTRPFPSQMGILNWQQVYLSVSISALPALRPSYRLQSFPSTRINNPRCLLQSSHSISLLTDSTNFLLTSMSFTNHHELPNRHPLSLSLLFSVSSLSLPSAARVGVVISAGSSWLLAGRSPYHSIRFRPLADRLLRRQR